MSNILTRKLMVQEPNYEIEPIFEQTSRDAEKKLYLSGKYILLNKSNRNKRKYLEDDMVPAIEAFKENYIKRNRAGGTLNHESSPEIDLGRLCHKIVSLERDEKNPDYYNGKSLVMSTPSGKVLSALVSDGYSVGMSSRALGRVINEGTESIVKDVVIVSIDAVQDPSISGTSPDDKTVGFVNGLLERKEWIVENAEDGDNIFRAYNALEKSLSKYPSKHQDAIRQHIMESLQTFLKSI